MNESGIKEGSWIYVSSSRIPAYVINVISESEVSAGYYQNDTKAIKEDFIFNGNSWEFEHSGPSGSYLSGNLEVIVKRGPYA